MPQSTQNLTEDDSGHVLRQAAIHRNVLIKRPMFSPFQNEHVAVPQPHGLVLGRLAVHKADDVLMAEVSQDTELKLVVVMELGLEEFRDINLIILGQLKQTVSN
jgi:hypothetical protein